MAEFKRLFTPIRIGQIEARNRLVMPAMGTNYGSPEGIVTRRTMDYYAARAEGGVGIVVVEVSCVDSVTGKQDPNEIMIDDDRFLPGLAELAATIKRHGARAAIQMNHAGGVAPKSLTGRQPLAPSPVGRQGYDVPREATIDELRHIAARFGEAAARVRRAGFDAIEIHGAHMYIIAQFLSPLWNKRKDTYGGSLENRARFLLDVIASIRRAVGRDYPVWARLNGAEYGVDGGIKIEETVQVARWAEAAGLDALHISGWYVQPTHVQGWSMPFVAGPLLPLAEAVKREVRIPVIGVGRVTPEMAEEAIRAGRVDLIAMGRALLADPVLPAKIREGRIDDVTPCTACWGCNYTFHHSLSGVRCQGNARLGREGVCQVTKATGAKQVLVIGGGPAGLEAARVAALRGHKVTLVEKDSRLGGQMIEAIIPPFKQGLQPLLDYLIRQIDKLGVDVKLGTEFSPALIASYRPHVMVVATGVRPLIPDIPGVNAPNVVLAKDVLLGEASTGKRVVVIGGELVGCETADFLAEKGKEVTVVRRGREIAEKVMPPVVKQLLLQRLAKNNVTLMPGVTYREINARGLVVTTASWPEKLIEADTVVLAAGAKPHNALYDAVKGMAPQVIPVGDCVQPRNIMEAITDGFNAALTI